MGTSKDDPPVIAALVPSLGAPFVQRVVKGVTGALRGTGVSLEWIEAGRLDGAAYHRAIEELAGYPGMRGLFYTHLKLNVNQLGAFRRRGIPVAGCAERAEGVDWICVDEEEAAYQATRYLLGLGHRQVALVNGSLVAAQSRLREDGYRRALEETGTRFSPENGMRVLNCSQEEGRAAAHMLMDLPQKPSAIFVAAGDVTALGVLTALRERGLEVPRDVSVVGFDNLAFANKLVPPLSTVNQPLETMGALAIQRLLQAMGQGTAHRPQGQVLDGDLVIRASACEPTRGLGRAFTQPKPS